MDLFEARKQLMSVLNCALFKKFNKIAEERKDNRYSLNHLRIVGKRQATVWRRHKRNFKFTRREMNNLHMFFSPLRIPDWLNGAEACFCLDLYEAIYPENTLIKDGNLDKLCAVLNGKIEVKLNERFENYLRRVLAEKIGINLDLKRMDEFFGWIESLPDKQKDAVQKRLGNITGFAKHLRDSGYRLDA